MTTRDPILRPERFPLFYKLLFAVFVLAVPVVRASSSWAFRDGDVSWHVAAGRWILEHGRIPKTDPFSFTMGGHPWVAFEWLSEVVYATAFNAAGYAGLAATVTLALMALYSIIFVYLRPRAGPIAIFVTFAALNLVLFPFILARPHVLAWPLLAGWTATLLHCRDRGRAPPLALALLMYVWANIHASFIIGFVIAAAIALDALIEAGWNRVAFKNWLLFGLLSLLAALLNANGLAGFLHPMTVAGLKTLRKIGEWQASSPPTTPFFYLILLGTLGALLFKRVKFRLGELLLLLLVVGMAFWYMRHQSVSVIVGSMIVVPLLAGQARGAEAPLFKSAADRRAWSLAALGAALIILGLRVAIPLTPKENAGSAHSLIAHVTAALRSEPVLNEYSFGGPLILAGIRPYIDGRSDMYGDDFFSDYIKMVDGDTDRFNRAVRKYDIRWTIFPLDDRMVKLLDASPDWKRLYSDRIGVIHVRKMRKDTAVSPASTPITDPRAPRDSDARGTEGPDRSFTRR